LKLKSIAIACVALAAISAAYLIYFRSHDTHECLPIVSLDLPDSNLGKFREFMDSTTLMNSAKWGNAESQYEVAWAYQHARECKYPAFKSDHANEDAYFWASLAAKSDPHFSAYRDKLAEKLTPQVIDRVKDQVAKWKPDGPKGPFVKG
jgi:hypothetical protein